MKIGWQFPLNNGGVGAGPNDGAIDHFTGNILSSVVREVIQNSLDARKNSDQPVRVAFCLDKVSKTNFAGFSEIQSFVKASSDMANAQGLAPRVKIYEKVLKELRTIKNIPVLSIHDWNTRGLEGPTDGTMVGNWYALTKGDGLTQKEGEGSLGSFGHGSKAPFTFSKTRTVFYYSVVKTKNGKMERRFQGKGKLQSHIHPVKKKPTQATGFFGKLNEDLLPLINDEIPGWFAGHRSSITDQTGTSLYIPFTYYDEGLFPETEITVVANFFYAIFNGKLEVQVGEELICKENIMAKFEWARKALANERDYIDVDHISECFESIETVINASHTGYIQDVNFGRIDWFLRLSDAVSVRRVGIARSTGMLITRRPIKLKQFPGTKLFDLFVCVSQPEGSEILKRIENPQHTDFSFGRIEDTSERKQIEKKYDILSEKIREVARKYAPLDIDDESEIDDLSDIFNQISDLTGYNERGERGARMLLLDGPPAARKSSPPKGNDNNRGGTKGSKERSKGKGRGTGTRGQIINPNGGRIVNTGDEEKVFSAGKKIPLENLRVVYSDGKQKEIKLHFSSSVAGNCLIKVQRSGELSSEDLELLIEKKKTKFFQTGELAEGRNTLDLTFTEPVDGYVLEAVMVQIAETDQQDQERVD